MTKPTKSVLVKVHTVLKGCLIESTEAFELPLDKKKEITEFLSLLRKGELS